MTDPEIESENPSVLTWICFISISIISVVVSIYALVQFFEKPGHFRGANFCINNLRQIDAAANQFALEHNLTNDSPINFPNDITPYIKLNSAGKIPGCPQGGIYHISKVGDAPTCSLGTTVIPAHVLP
jgi:hypothetical protein